MKKMMTKISRFNAMIVAIGILACGTANAEDIAWPQDCPRYAEDDARLAPLRGKLPDAINNPSIDQLADHSRPNAQQRKALIIYDAARSKCESELSEGYNGVARTSFIAYASKSKKLRVRLYSGQIDFAAFVSQDQDNLEAFNGSLDTINTEDAHEKAERQRVENEAAAQQQMQRQMIANQQQALQQQRAQYEAAQQRQQMQDLSNSLRELGNSFQRNAPVVTNCYSSYGTTSCTTR